MTRTRQSASAPDGFRRGGARAAGLLWMGTALFLLGVVITGTGWDRANRYVAALTALRPHAVVLGLVLVALGLVLRRWGVTVVLALAMVVLLVPLVPRLVGDNADPVRDGRLRVLSVNAHFGAADPTRIARLVREQRVDVLSVQELTPELAAALDRAGVSEALPHGAWHPAAGGAGAAVLSRYPAREVDLVGETTGPHPAVRVRAGGDRPVEFVAVHSLYPMGPDTTRRWARDLGALPTPSPVGTPRVLVGDFNATVDHTPMRDLLDNGYRDAGVATGRGLVPTWPDADGWPLPLVTLDHVLTSGPLAVTEQRTTSVPGTDHRAVFTELAVGIAR